MPGKFGLYDRPLTDGPPSGFDYSDIETVAELEASLPQPKAAEPPAKPAPAAPAKPALQRSASVGATPSAASAADISKKGLAIYEGFHHSSFTAGDPVAAAGEMRAKQGVLELISNESGHYQPAPWFLAQALL